jgi:hypothetical protein
VFRARDARALGIGLFVALALAAPVSLAAQVRLGVTAGTLVFSGASSNTDPNDPETVRPHGAYAWGGALSLQRGAWQVRLGVARSKPGVIVGDNAVQVVDRSILGLTLIEPTVARRLFTSGEAAAMWLEVGPTIYRWSPTTLDARTKTGGAVALAWNQPAQRRVDLTVRVHVSATASPFVQSDLPTGIEPATLWRTGVSLELSRRM